MSGVYIKGMEMPKDGVYWCEIGVAGEIAMITIHGEDRKSFPLIPVPDHGRLIDAEKLHTVLRERSKEFSNSEYGEGVKCGLADAREYIKIAPTIIPASKEDA